MSEETTAETPVPETENQQAQAQGPVGGKSESTSFSDKCYS